MPKKTYRLVSPKGAAIIGTLDTIEAMACVQGVESDERDSDGELSLEYSGDTEVFWDSQKTQRTPKGERLFLDANHDEWPESQLVVVVEEEPHGAEAVALMEQLGFKSVYTGGGFSARIRNLTSGKSLWLTTTDDKEPTDLDAPVRITLCEGEDFATVGVLNFSSLRKLLDYLMTSCGPERISDILGALGEDE